MITLNTPKQISYRIKTTCINGFMNDIAPHGGVPYIAKEKISQTPKSFGCILVVDDNKDAADALGNLFQTLGYDTAIAYNGTDGMSVFNEAHPRFAFLDIAMPDISGYDLARRIREKAGSKVILIAVTGFGQIDDKAHAREAGFDYHLTKPIILNQIQNILGKHDDQQTSALS